MKLNTYYSIFVLILLSFSISINSQSDINDDGTSYLETSFYKKFSGTSWTNGSDTIKFKKLSGLIEDWSDVIGPKMWYLYSVDGPFYVLPCDDCYTANECHMCGYNAIKLDEQALELFWDYQNDFFAESEGVKFISKQEKILSSVISRQGYFGDYSSDEIKWFPLNSDLSDKEQAFIKNKIALDDFEQKKAKERVDAEKEIFD
jgi:hypothetical protein